MSEYIAGYDGESLRAVFALRRGVRVVRDPLRRSRLRWFSLGWIVAIPTLILGGAFLLLGQRVVIAKGAFVIYGKLPGGLHLHGLLMFLLGLSLVVGLSTPIFGYPERWDYLRPLLRIVALYYAWSTFMFALAPAAPQGVFSLLAVVFWGTWAFLPLVLLIGPPPPLVPRDETDLIRAAVGVGISPEHARALNEVYFHGGPDASV